MLLGFSISWQVAFHEMSARHVGILRNMNVWGRMQKDELSIAVVWKLMCGYDIIKKGWGGWGQFNRSSGSKPLTNGHKGTFCESCYLKTKLVKILEDILGEIDSQLDVDSAFKIFERRVPSNLVPCATMATDTSDVEKNRLLCEVTWWLTFSINLDSGQWILFPSSVLWSYYGVYC